MISIIIPTLNEALNIKRNCDLFSEYLVGLDYEIIFVDDMSSDGTFEICQEIGKYDPKVRSILRHQRTGLSSAAIEGMLSSRFEYLCIVDADLQYSFESLRDGISALDSGKDLVIMTRTLLTERISSSLPAHRRFLTEISSFIFRKFIKYKISDPNSGFFIIKKKLILERLPELSCIGFKLLLDILMTSGTIKIIELPTNFNDRQFGVSKLSSRIFIDLIEMLIDKLTGSNIFGAFILYCISGTFGILIMFIVQLFSLTMNASLSHSLVFSAIISIPLNFYINNIVTFRSNKIKKFNKLMEGLFKYFIICFLGLFINQAILNHYNIELTSLLFASFVAGVWNFILSKTFVWRVK